MAMNPFRKKFSVEDIPDLAGKVIIVTGGATGIGKQAVEQLLRHNAKVYVASRSKRKFEQLFNHLKSVDPHIAAGLNFLELDLSDTTSCISAAKHFAKLEGRLDVLIANAALAVVPETLSSDGIEVQFGTNYFGHFVFTHNLLDLIQYTSEAFGEARIVIVSSHAHAMYKPVVPDKIDFEGLWKEGPKTINSLADVQASLQRYALSKLANILFAQRLHTHFQATGYSNILVNCLNPGTVGTAPGTESAALPLRFKFINSSIVRLMSIPPEDGALTMLLVATDPEVKSKSLSGRYFDVGPLAGKFYYGYSWDATDSKLSDVAKDEHLSEMLWNWSIETAASVNITS
ncbi:carbonyl reductase [Penicillium canescens]|uniref:Carbonyl reductase n=1 Tax=Penicillium canescens TaxID=5083 RepID=A0AAD6I8J5_PENCN|nr:carbonyl reductase [Penicillium canescens]KAJ6001308.1 carbonyl reductase [Penicillium canescens]KAJ6035653.1 carbonyl reductase [Penicillium canescens]KAJ6037775.1 carbonyl reductase [Penicillium canescens]KAJ6054402.1 carbonyl reductase [Penicillium canescens]